MLNTTNGVSATTFTGSAALANAWLANERLVASASGNSQVTVTVTDGYDSTTQTIYLNTANTAATASAGSAVTPTVGAQASLAGMSIVDPDSNDVITATINAASGVSLSVNGTNATGATITAISANQMVVSGSAAQVNSAIDLLQASATSAGSQTISLSASDGISSSSANLTMNVTPNAPGAPAVISAISSGVSAGELSSGFDLTVSLLGLATFFQSYRLKKHLN